MLSVIALLNAVALMVVVALTGIAAVYVSPTVSLGVLPRLTDGVLIMVAVTGMFLTHRLVMLVRK